MNNESKKIIRDIIPKKELDHLSPFQKKEEKRELKAIKHLPKKTEISTAKKTKGESFDIFDTNNTETKFLKWILISIPLFLALVITAYLMMPASAAIIKITPESKTVKVNVFIKLSDKDGDIKLPFITIKEERDGQITGSGNEFIQKKASGVIVVYNNFSSSPQTLIRSTRFETPEGKIYRLQNTITVPGIKKQGNEQIAGSIEAAIIADKDGKEYNLDFSDFTLPGFKGSQKYAKIYARSKSAINGGFAGNMPKINEKDLNDTRQKIEEELKTEIWNKLANQIPEGFTPLKESEEFKFSYENISSDETKNILNIKEKAEFTVALINKNDLAYFLSKKYSKNNSFEKNIYLKNLDNIKFTVLKKDLETKEIIVKAEGETKIIKMIDEQKLKNKLAAAKNKDVIFISHPEIIKADIILKPFFKLRFPTDSSKIQINIEI